MILVVAPLLSYSFLLFVLTKTIVFPIIIIFILDYTALGVPVAGIYSSWLMKVIF